MEVSGAAPCHRSFQFLPKRHVPSLVAAFRFKYSFFHTMSKGAFFQHIVVFPSRLGRCLLASWDVELLFEHHNMCV